jgi:hypothetical protein
MTTAAPPPSRSTALSFLVDQALLRTRFQVSAHFATPRVLCFVAASVAPSPHALPHFRARQTPAPVYPSGQAAADAMVEDFGDEIDQADELVRVSDAVAVAHAARPFTRAGRGG